MGSVSGLLGLAQGLYSTRGTPWSQRRWAQTPSHPPQTEAQKVVGSIVDGREKRTVETYSYPDFFAGSRHEDGVARVI